MDILQQRQARMEKLTQPLPGSVPYVNRRPLNVPARFAGLCLIDFLCDRHPQTERDVWLRKHPRSPTPKFAWILSSVCDRESGLTICCRRHANRM